MRYPIKKALTRQNLKSNGALAGELLAAYPEVFIDKEKKPLKLRTLSAKLSELDRGMTAWWRNRPLATQSLTIKLGIEQSELDLNPVDQSKLFPLPSFLAFPPLFLNRETPWRIADATRDQDIDRVASRYGVSRTLDYWLDTKRRNFHPDHVQWLCVPDAVEFEILTRRLTGLGYHQVRRAATPEAALTRYTDELMLADSLIVVVDGVGDGEPVGQLANLRYGAPLLIIARDPLPGLAPEPKQDGEAANSDLGEFSTQFRIAKDLAARTAHGEIECWTWTLMPNWRERLLAAIERRMRDLGTDKPFSSNATQALLDKFDRSHQWFVNVDDVLVLCQTVCEGEEENLRNALKSGTDTAGLLSLLFYRDEAHLDQMRHLSAMRWISWKLSWLADLSLEEWITLTKTRERFDTLVSRNLIAQHGLGYRFQRPVVIRLLLRSYLVEQMSKDELDNWALACFDDERRPLADAALDTLSVDDLQRLARKIGAACVKRPVYLGAAEALFAALGRRMPHAKIDSYVLAEFGKIVIPTLRSHAGIMWPVSRSLASPSDELGWMTVCWAWSQHVHTLTEGSWQFPGWSDKLPDYPDWLNMYGRPHSRYSWDRVGPQLWEFVSAARTWLKSFPRGIEYAKLSPLFNMALLLNAAESGLNPEQWWWEGVIGDPAAEHALLEYGMPEKGPQLRAMALTWWTSLMRHRRETFRRQVYAGSTLFSRQRRANDYSPVFAQVFDILSANPAEAIQAIDSADRSFLARYAVSLPPAFQRELLIYVAQGDAFHWYGWEVPGFMAQFGPQVADSLPNLLDHPQLGAMAALRLWDWAPAKAKGLLRTYRKLSDSALQNLLMTCSMDAIDLVLAVQRREPRIMSCEQWREWALRRLPNARAHAPALLQLLEISSESHSAR